MQNKQKKKTHSAVKKQSMFKMNINMKADLWKNDNEFLLYMRRAFSQQVLM